MVTLHERRLDINTKTKQSKYQGKKKASLLRL